MLREQTEKTQWLIYALPMVILACFAVAYWPVFQKMLIRWEGGDNSYCYLIVPLVLYLLYDIREKGEARRATDDRRRTTEESQVAKVRGPQTSSNAILKPETTGGFRFDVFSWSIWGIVPVLLSVLLIIAGEQGSVETFMYAGIWGCAVGMIFILYGWRVRYLFFPILILMFIVPLPAFINRTLTFKLKLAASTLSTAMLRLTGVSVLQEGNIIDLGISQLQVVDACSGLRYLMPLVLTGLLVGYFFNKKLWQKIVLVLMVVPLSIFVNAVRIWITGILTVKGYEKLAQSFFHDFSGWLIYMIAGAVLVGAALLLRAWGNRKEKRGKSKRARAQKSEVRDQTSGVENQGKGRRTTDEGRETKGEARRTTEDGRRKTEESKKSEVRGQKSENEVSYSFHLPSGAVGSCPSEAVIPPSSPSKWTKPVVLTILMCLLFAGSGWALKAIPSAGNLPERMTFESFPMHIGKWQGDRHYISKEILENLWADDYISATYSRPDSANHINLLIPFYKYQGTLHTAHAPQSCMLGSGWALFNSGERFVNLNPHGKINIMTMIWEKGDYKLLGSYFFLQRGRVITSPWMNKFYLMVDAFTKRRTDGALVRAEMTVAPGQSEEEAYKVLEGFIAQLWPILPKYIPN